MVVSKLEPRSKHDAVKHEKAVLENMPSTGDIEREDIAIPNGIEAEWRLRIRKAMKRMENHGD